MRVKSGKAGDGRGTGLEEQMIRDVVFMGTPDFAVGTLQALIDSPDYAVRAVFTQPDKARGRGKAMQMPPVKETALAAGIPVYQPEKIREKRWMEELEKLRPDVIVVVAFGQIIPEEILKLPPGGCINVHASLLPKYRGAAPIQRAVINGERESGVTTMRMDVGLDTGDMIMRETVTLAPDETGGSLFDKLSAVGASLLLRTLDAISDGTAQYERQPQESPTPYAAMLTKKDGRVDWTKGAAQIERLIRGLNPWPSAYTTYRGKTLKLWAAEAVGRATNVSAVYTRGESGESACELRAAELQAGVGADIAAGAEAKMPGTAAEVTKNSLKIRTGDGLLSILELQPEGKKRMTVDAFLRGYPVEPGELFGA